MSSLIEDVRQDFKEFWKLPIKQGDVTYRKTYFDRINASLIFDRLVENTDKDDLALVTPDDPTITLLVIIESLLSLLKYDMLNGSSQILSTLKTGDSVGLMQNRKMLPGIYTGAEEVDGRIFHCVRTEDGVITKIPPGRSKWRIQPYMAANLSGRKRSTLVFGEVLEDLIGLPPGGLMAFQRSKALLVTPEKGRVIESIRGVTLGGDAIEAIFPMADYSDASNRHHIGNNALKREPILGLVSNTDTAVDIALKDPAIKLIIIDGASKVRTSYGSIERLNADSVPRKIICLLKTADEEEIATLAAMNIDSWIWKRADFTSTENLHTSSGGDQPFELHSGIVTNLSGASPQTVSVPALSQLDDAIKNAAERIRIISRQTPPSAEAGYIFRWGVSLLNNFLQLPVSMREYETYVESLSGNSVLGFDKKLDDFEEKLRASYGFVIPSTLKGNCEELIHSLKDIYKILSLRNPKAEALRTLINEHKNEKVTIVCCKSEYAEACRKVFNHTVNIKAISISEAGSSVEDNAIITGWLNRRMAAKLFLAPYRNLTYLLYNKEFASYSQVLQKHPASPLARTDASLREKLGLKEKRDSGVQEIVPDIGEDIETLINSVYKKFGGPSYTDQLQSFSAVDMVKARRVVFEDDSYAYLTDTQGLDKLDRNNRSTTKCRLRELSPGDELIFAESGRDMFEELLAIIQETEKYKTLFEKARLWHRVLEEYMDKNHLNEQQLITQLALVGNRPDIVTVRAWIKGSVISPAKDYLAALAKVTGNEELKNKLGDVTDACTKLYALHIQTGRLLVRRIIKAAVQENEDILNAEASEKLEQYSQSARVVTIREVSEDTQDIPLRATGKVFEI